MSRHRFIRNLDIDDELDDYYGDDDEYDRPAPVVKKVSKLAALAAARKNQVNKLPTSELQAVRQPVRTPTNDVSIRLQKASNVTGRVNGTSNNKGEQAGRPSMEASLESSSITPTIRLSDVQGTPSPFARTIKGQESQYVTNHLPSGLSDLIFPSPSSLNGFKKPSPDDQYVLGQKRAERGITSRS